MPKMQVYLPDELYVRLQQHRTELNVSNLLQDVLEHELDECDRQAALATLLAERVTEHGDFTDAELAAQEESDREGEVVVNPRGGIDAT